MEWSGSIPRGERGMIITIRNAARLVGFNWIKSRHQQLLCDGGRVVPVDEIPERVMAWDARWSI